MESLLLFAALAVSALYLVLVASNGLGMARLARGSSSRTPRVSILVAARDEEAHLARCLHALLAQDYAGRAELEIRVVDDRSRDATGEILERFAGTSPRITALRVDSCPEGHSGKTFALSRAMEGARGEILCVTDADCAPPPGWVSALVAHFEDDVGLVAGPALRHVADGRRTLIGELARMLSITGIAMGAGGAGWGRPWTCAGANLAFRREAFVAAGGYARLCHSASGDDDLLMHRIAARTRWRVRFALSSEACVPSFEDGNASDFSERQSRHLASFRDHPLRVQGMSLVVFAYYLWFLAGPFLAQVSTPLGLAWLGSGSLRIAIECLTLQRCARSIGTSITWKTLLLAQGIFPALVLHWALAGLRGRFTWKGESFGARAAPSFRTTPAPRRLP